MDLETGILSPGDSKAYRSIRLEALERFPELFCSSFQEQVRLEKLYFERLIEESSEKGKMVGAFCDNELVAICGVTFETRLLPGAGEIVQMYVRPEVRHRGIGRKLIAAAKDICLSVSAGHLVLEVIRSNRGAIALYQSCGFKVDESLGYDPDTHVMTLPVDR